VSPLRAAPVLVAALLLAATEASAGIAYTSRSTHTLALLAQGSIPLQLAAGPDDSTTELSVALSGTLTGSKVANSLPGTYDALFVNNTSSSDYQMRLVLVSATNQSDCTRCKLWVSNLSSGAKVLQVNITGGTIQQSSGSWEAVNRDGAAGDEYHVWVEHNVSTGKRVSLSYKLEYAPSGASSPLVSYGNMTFVGRGTVDVSNNVFTPSTFTIAAGESVTWHWVQGRHGVEDLNGNAWCSTRSAPAPDCSRAFATAGTYNYRCIVHQNNMLGTIEVT
jgi:plastocyanin